MSKNFHNTSFLFGANAPFIEELYQKYLEDATSVDASWVKFFQEEEIATKLKTTTRLIYTPVEGVKSERIASESENNLLARDLKAKFMINAYREHGHYLAQLDPLEIEQTKTHVELKLTLADFDFNDQQLDEIVNVENIFGDITECTIGELRNLLEKIYANKMAVQFDHVEATEERNWLYLQMEKTEIQKAFPSQEQKNILQDLVEIEEFEQYLHKKFPGAKRFSIEGGEAAINILNMIVKQAAQNKVQEIVLGLAHRGRLATLAKVMKKPYRAIFSEFMGASSFPTDLGISGDVKYHMGFSSDRVFTDNQQIHLSLTPNPSHLEAVNPVVAGKVRAKQDYFGRDRSKVIGVLVHGDTAFCGQGVVAESLIMSGLKPYNIGGMFHLVINNQIGFTANNYDSRPGRYCTEVAKMVGAPILHVNGDDIESVLRATKIAYNYRRKFNKDIVIDLVCYRKYGHNEGDEPMYTQSMMYKRIKQKKTVAEIYARKLIDDAVIDETYYSDLKKEFRAYLASEFEQVKDYKPTAQWLEGLWSGLKQDAKQSVITGLDRAYIEKLAGKLCHIPSDFPVNHKLLKLLTNRLKRLKQEGVIDWAAAEQLAFASLLDQNIPVRITGQDAGRGTFSHRHAVLHSQENNDKYEPLNNISEQQAFFEVADSNLSEYGVLGFEYGYSLVNPKHLVIWEAQFGDFCNGAQIIFDQFISSAETKWLRMSGLVCLLPHAMEGQGPEHSSARLERFLQLCAQNNIQVVYPTTPASIFHLLRRQILSVTRKPLIIMSPKSLLRHKLAVSDLNELEKNTYFTEVIDEVDINISPSMVKRLVFCTGKVYYDLLEKRKQEAKKDVALIRLEQLYPFPQKAVKAILAKYTKAEEFVWGQEEPNNMGSWHFISPYIGNILKESKIKQKLIYVGRVASPSPAVGCKNMHDQQQQTLVLTALGITS